MRADVKALTHWVIYKGYQVRFTDRSVQLVTGILTTSEGTQLPFQYDPARRTIRVAGELVKINEYGWEVEREPIE
jgi:hypothetical protein